jgi:hypothetical protein
MIRFDRMRESERKIRRPGEPELVNDTEYVTPGLHLHPRAGSPMVHLSSGSGLRRVEWSMKNGGSGSKPERGAL